MARIRTIKPEFWDSPSVAKASPWGRLLFIAMWNWADDFGRGTANLKELEGFAFPHDDEFTDRSGNAVHFRALVAEVSECFGVLFYEVDGRQFFEIPTWDAHQRNERRSKASKHPDPPGITRKNRHVAETPSHVAETPRTSGPGTGEQGNRGTGEQGNRGAGADAPLSPFCSKHPNGTEDNCRPCGTARTAFARAQAAEKAKPTPMPFTVAPGSICVDGKHVLVADGTCTRCTYRPEVGT